MTFTGDHRDQLGDRRDWVPIDDAAAETLLCGGETTPDLEPVAGFIRTLRESARRRVVPSARLAARMARGWPPGPGSPPVRAYARTGRHRPGRHGGSGGAATSRLMAWAGAAGLVMAIVGTATAGFARALPEPAQQRFEAVVEVVTGHEFAHRPDRDGSGLAPVGAPADDRPGGPGGPGVTDRGPGGGARIGAGPVTGDRPDAAGPAAAEAALDGSAGSEPAGEAPDEAAAPPGASPTGLGGEVREGAREGSADGGEVSGWARANSSGAEDSSSNDGDDIDDDDIDGGNGNGGDTGSTGGTDGSTGGEATAAGRVEPYGVKPATLAGAGGVPASWTPDERPSGQQPPTRLAPLAPERLPQPPVGVQAPGGAVTAEQVAGAGA